MSGLQKLKQELAALALAMGYFGLWVLLLIVLKKLVLAEYDIEFRGLSMALVGTLVLSKVVLVLEHVPLGAWVRAQPAWLTVLLRTALYAAGVVVVLVAERAFEARHEYSGFGPALTALLRQQLDIYHVWANTIALSLALLGWNLLWVVRLHLGTGGLARLFRLPLPREPEDTPAMRRTPDR